MEEGGTRHEGKRDREKSWNFGVGFGLAFRNEEYANHKNRARSRKKKSSTFQERLPLSALLAHFFFFSLFSYGSSSLNPRL